MVILVYDPAVCALILNVGVGCRLQTFVRRWLFLIPVMDYSSSFKSEEYKTPWRWQQHILLNRS